MIVVVPHGSIPHVLGLASDGSRDVGFRSKDAGVRFDPNTTGASRIWGSMIGLLRGVLNLFFLAALRSASEWALANPIEASTSVANNR